MSAAEALRLAQENGIRVGVAGEDLILDADREPAPGVLEAIRRHKAGLVTLFAGENDGWLAEDWRVFFDERAGIAEFDGGQSWADAEALAFECCTTEWMNRNPVASSPDHCLACGEGDHANDPLLPFGTNTQGHSWLHSPCWTDWREARKADAAAALKAMGIEERAKFPNDFGKNGGA